MILFPQTPAPNGCTATLIENGGTMRSPSGVADRFDRLGGHYVVNLTFPPMPNDGEGRKFVAKLIRAKRQGMKIDFPLLGVYQGLPGAPVMDGANQTGHTISVRGFTPHYAGGEGFWFSVTFADGSVKLHNVSAFQASAAGLATFSIEPAIGGPLPDGAALQFAVPMIEGYIEGGDWNMSLARNIEFSVMLEERK